MKTKDVLVRVLKHSWRFFSKKSFTNAECVIDRQLSNDIIYEKLIGTDSFLLSRFGTTELITINNYLCIKSSKSFNRKLIDYITDHTHLPWWHESNFNFLEIYSGVFPPTEETSIKFAQKYLADIPKIDILGSFQYYEKFMPLRNNVKLLHLETLYPFFVDRPWTSALKGKKVLVVHPFESTIQNQYVNRKKLFENPETLPDFELITLKSVQSAAGIKTGFKNWFDALYYMENKISDIDFDVCLLGCGAYGLPLAAHIKKMGKKAIHLGGGLQLLFGIRGKRWDNSNYGIREYKAFPKLMRTQYNSLYNDFWIRPLVEDTPKSNELLDGGIYW